MLISLVSSLWQLMVGFKGKHSFAREGSDWMSEKILNLEGTQTLEQAS